jgi:hypothetical protein
MAICSPVVAGPLSECSRSVLFNNAIRGASVNLTRIRSGTPQRVGSTLAVQSSGTVELEAGEDFREGDLVTVSQEFNGESSQLYGTSIEIQRSADKFNPPQVLTHLYQCSHGFHLGAMRPGTRVEVLNGPDLIGRGASIDGTAYVDCFPDGLPGAGSQLTIRQRVCPKPPPPGGALEWVINHPLPKVESYTEFPVGSEFPAPVITNGLYNCSQSIEISNIIAGLTVLVTAVSGAWWASLGASDNTTAWLTLPAALTEGEEVEITHQFGRRCGEKWKFARDIYAVSPQQQLPKPKLAPVECSTVPVLTAFGLKAEADVEIEVNYTSQGQQKNITYRSTAAKGTSILPAPPMPKESILRIRQGECGLWSAWSEPKAVPVDHKAPHEPRIVSDLFHCQNFITVSNLHPASGTLHVISNFYGEIKQVPVNIETMTVAVAPSLQAWDEVYVEHKLCGNAARSALKDVRPVGVPGIDEIKGPIYEGDTELTVQRVTAGAFIEIRDATNNNKLLAAGYAHATDNSSSKVDVQFPVVLPLKFGHHIYALFWHCGHYGRNEGIVVEYHPPVLKYCVPGSFQRSKDYVGRTYPFSLTAVGSYFRSGAKILWENSAHDTTYRSNNPPLETSLDTWISASISNVVKKYKVKVRNSDGKVSNEVHVELLPYEEPVTPPPPPPPPEKSDPFLTVNVADLSPGESAKKLKITGLGFEPIEELIIYINIKSKDTYPNGVDNDQLETDADTEPLIRQANSNGALGHHPTLIEHSVLYAVNAQSVVKVKAKGKQSGDSNIVSVLV